ncbi:hypothetical protein [Caviibacterium pharyngocola]|uniref:Uncharacterized protein n=1 Tax=Caviibacterium pharyngocola TaxID=28159 RepID=A0A2M8RSK2_9PAST|nr:hypothetical protein [Caviibacterium pharyngocola]PJG81871.1 hypothetical protein CVP04_12140 [Caviibacterium pharyngocola]
MQAYIEGKDPLYAMGASAVATGVGAGFGKLVEKGSYRTLVGDTTRNKNYYEPRYRTPEMMGALNEKYQYLPTKLGNLFDAGVSQTVESLFENQKNLINDLLNRGNNE